MPSKSVFILFLSLGWFLICSQWYCCWMGDGCPNCTSTGGFASMFGIGSESEPDLSDTKTIDEKLSKFPISFNWSDSKPRLSGYYENYKEALIEAGSSGELLEITGYYFIDELIPEEYPDMGIARADAVLELFQKDVNRKNILIKSAIANPTGKEQEENFPAVSFKWISPRQ